MANNPQARNLPQIRFPKRVGQAPLKAFVQDVIETTISDLVRDDVDLTDIRLDVILTRANTGRTNGSLGTWYNTPSDMSNLRKGDIIQTDLTRFRLMLNLGPSANSHKNDADLIKTLMHETIHFVQYVTGILTSTAQWYGGRNLVKTRTWNVTAGYVLNYRARGDCDTSFFGSSQSLFPRESRPLTHREGDRVETIARAPRSTRTDRTYAQYLAQPHERQAWTQVLPLARRHYPQAVEVCRKSYRTAVKEVAKHKVPMFA